MKQSSRNLILFAIFTLVSTFGLAQPTLNNSVFIDIGETFITVLADTVGVEAGPAGANQTWNFSNLSPAVGLPSDTTTYVAPGATPFAMDFPTANLCGVSATDGFYTYLKKDANQFIYLGAAADTISIMYSDPDIILETPLNFNGSFSDSYEVVFNDPMAMLIMSGDKTTTYDAYGTLELPTGTYNNTIRLKVVEMSQDSAALPSGYILTETTDTEYIWFQNGTSGPLLTINYSEGTTTIVVPPAPPFVNPIPPSKSVSYLQSGTTSTGEPGQSDLVFSVKAVQPNPATTEVRVTVTAEKSLSDVSLTVVNELGEVQIQQQRSLNSGENQLTVPVQDLAAGAYWLVFRTPGGASSHAFIKQ